jgi:hypothetical protein
MTTIENTIKLGQMLTRLTALMDKNPTAALRVGSAIERESGPVTLSATFEDAQTAINAMSNGPRQAAADTVAELEREWVRVSATMRGAEIEHLKQQVGPNPVMLAMRARLIAEIRAKGGDVRTVGGL